MSLMGVSLLGSPWCGGRGGTMRESDYHLI